jgi:hypothetical protein
MPVKGLLGAEKLTKSNLEEDSSEEEGEDGDEVPTS